MMIRRKMKDVDGEQLEEKQIDDEDSRFQSLS